MLRRWLIDCRQASRGLARSPGFTAVAVLVLGLGIGATVALYATVQRILIDPLAFPHSDRLVIVRSEVPGSGVEAEWAASTAQYFRFREHAEESHPAMPMSGPTIPCQFMVPLRLGAEGPGEAQPPRRIG